MSDKVDRFVEKLRDQLNATEAKFDTLKANMDSASKESKAKIDAKLAEAKAAANKAKQDVDAAGAKVKANIEEKKAHTEQQIADWKYKKEVKKLERHAQLAEDDAAWAAYVAMDAVANADVAMLNAVVARLDADEAATAGV
jgi:hypothetical protein